MSIVTLNTPSVPQLDMPHSICVPLIVTRDGRTFIVIRTPQSTIFFNTVDGSVTYCSVSGYLEENYKFVRFLDKGESFTFTQ